MSKQSMRYSQVDYCSIIMRASRTLFCFSGHYKELKHKKYNFVYGTFKPKIKKYFPFQEQDMPMIIAYEQIENNERTNKTGRFPIEHS